MVDIIILVSIFVYFSNNELGEKKGEADHEPEKQLSPNNNFFTQHNKNIKIHTQA